MFLCKTPSVKADDGDGHCIAGILQETTTSIVFEMMQGKPAIE
jgi:hypothetical protein